MTIFSRDEIKQWEMSDKFESNRIKMSKIYTVKNDDDELTFFDQIKLTNNYTYKNGNIIKLQSEIEDMKKIQKVFIWDQSHFIIPIDICHRS